MDTVINILAGIGVIYLIQRFFIRQTVSVGGVDLSKTAELKLNMTPQHYLQPHPLDVQRTWAL